MSCSVMCVVEYMEIVFDRLLMRKYINGDWRHFVDIFRPATMDMFGVFQADVSDAVPKI